MIFQNAAAFLQKAQTDDLDRPRRTLRATTVLQFSLSEAES